MNIMFFICHINHVDIVICLVLYVRCEAQTLSLLSIFWINFNVHLQCSSNLLKFFCSTESGCSKLTTSLVNVSLKFQMLISEKCHYFFVEKM